MYVAHNNLIEVAKFLIKNNASVDAFENDGNNVLMYACSNIKVNFDVINPNASTNQSSSSKSTEINPHNQLSYSRNDTASFSNSSQSANSSKPEEPKTKQIFLNLVKLIK